MGKSKKMLYFQLLRYIKSALNLALLVLCLFLLIPSHPFNGEDSHWIELVDRAEGKGADELLNIYSVVKSHTMDLRDASAWAISETILEESRKHSLDPMLVLAVINVESSFRHTAVSRKGARGLMQIRPFVANALVAEVDLKNWEGEKSLDDPILNIKLGVFYLHYLKKNFRDLRLALTAYNWGPTDLRTRLEGDQAIPLGYATKVLSAYHRYHRYARRTRKKS